MKTGLAKAMMMATVLSLVGCASTELDKNYAKYLDSQVQLQANKQQQPLVRLKALSGQSIVLSGVEEFVVFAPEGQQTHTNVQQYQTPRNDFVEVAKSALGVVGAVGGIWAGGQAAKGLVNATGAAANHGYQFVQAPQAPQPNLTIGGNGVIGAGSYTNNPTTTTTTSFASGGSVIGAGTAMSGTGVLGSGTYGMVSGNGTTGAGNFDGSNRSINNSYNPSTVTNDNHTYTGK